MSKNSDYCLGCGAKKQSLDEKSAGFVNSLDQKYCVDCFKLKNYGEVYHNFHPDKLVEIKPNSICLMISSILHLDLLFSYPVYRYQPNAKYIYIINQMDILPLSTNLDYLLDNIVKKAKELKIPYEDIIFMSALNNGDINNLKNYLKQFDNREIYLLGVQNSGKTTIYKNLTGDTEALAIIKAGLTQEKLIGKMDNLTIIDMPGLFQDGYLHTFLDYEIYKKMIPTKRIKPRIYQVKENDAIFIEGLIAISYDKGLPQTIVFYVENNIRFHKTNKKKLNNSFDTLKQLSKLYVNEYESKTFKIKEDKRYQITFSDMGFMHIVTKGTITVTYPKGMHITMTEALFK